MVVSCGCLSHTVAVQHWVNWDEGHCSSSWIPGPVAPPSNVFQPSSLFRAGARPGVTSSCTCHPFLHSTAAFLPGGLWICLLWLCLYRFHFLLSLQKLGVGAKCSLSPLFSALWCVSVIFLWPPIFSSDPSFWLLERGPLMLTTPPSSWRLLEGNSLHYFEPLWKECCLKYLVEEFT